jgi:molybdopterin-binding protein
MLRIGAVAAALGVSPETLRRWEREGRIAFKRRGGQRLLSSDDVAGLVADRPASARRTSARNRLDGVVISVVTEGVMAKVEMACGPLRVISLMSREAAGELGLSPGVQARAIVKSTDVLVEPSR